MTCDVERGAALTVSGVGPPLTTVAVLPLVVAAGCLRDTDLADPVDLLLGGSACALTCR